MPLIEQNPGQSEHSKALAIMPRTMEIFEMAGIVDRFVREANPARAASVVAHGRRLARIPFEPAESDYPYVAMIPQDVTERLLAEALGGVGGRVEYLTRLVGFEQDGDQVTATVEAGGARRRLRARFLVGADGAHSTVRHALGLPFAGSKYDHAFVLADVELPGALPTDEMQLCPSADGPLAIFPMGGASRRIVATWDRGDGAAPTLGLVRDLLRQRGPAGADATRLIWSSSFQIHRRQTPQMRAGRVFLAGDAAHIHSPFGAQGMNTGLQDAWNLAWKLVFAVRGLASDALLASYSQERHPVARDVIRATDLLTRAMGTPSELVQSLRDRLIPVIGRLPSFQHRFVQTLSELAVHYAGSPIVEGTGRRIPNLRLPEEPGAPESRLYDLLDDRYLLLLAGPYHDGIDEMARDLVGDYGEAVELRWARGGSGGLRVRLVRPDGYLALDVAIRNPARGGFEPLGRRLRTLLERQVVTSAGAATVR